MQFRFENNAPKGTCISCGSEGRYRYFYDTVTGLRLPAEYGRCDRENTCGYFKAPPKNYTPTNETTETVDYALVKKSLSHPHKNAFFNFLSNVFDETTALAQVQLYEVGSANENKTVFWYKDEYGYYRNAKVYLYQSDGKRDKSFSPRYQFTKSQGYTIPIFGSHIIPMAQGTAVQKIAVVESEKSAVIASAIYKDTVWLASGGSYMLTEERCKRLSKLSKMLNNAPVHLFPDSDDSGRKGFKTAGKRLQTLITPVIYHDIFPERNDGWDLADEILSSRD
jgi:hypothetical protein